MTFFIKFSWLLKLIDCAGKISFHIVKSKRFEIILHNILSFLNANSYITNQQSITNSHSLSDSNKSINYLVGWNKQNKNYKSIDVRHICLGNLIGLSENFRAPRSPSGIPPLLSVYSGSISDFLINLSPAIPVALVNVKRFLPSSLLSNPTIDPTNPDLTKFQSPVWGCLIRNILLLIQKN